MIYGTNGKVLNKKILQNHTCESCGQEEHAAVGVIRYCHIFFIPFFIYAKKIHRICLHCKKSTELTGLSTEEVTSKENNLFGLKETWPYYSLGWLSLGLIAYLVLMFLYFMVTT